MLVGNVRNLLKSGAPESYFTLTLLTNIRLSWKGLPRTNTLAYYKTLVNYDRKKFYNIGPWGQCYKTFLSVIYEFSNKLVFVRGKPFQPSVCEYNQSQSEEHPLWKALGRIHQHLTRLERFFRVKCSRSLQIFVNYICKKVL
jgi:hypothetical protein